MTFTASVASVVATGACGIPAVHTRRASGTRETYLDVMLCHLEPTSPVFFKRVRNVEQSAAPGNGRARLGKGGESLAATWLESRGMRVLARNWRCPYGEIDLIAAEGDELVFVEVKTRRGQALGAPEEAITPAKRRHLIAAAQAYLADHAREDAAYRIDVVAVQLAPSGRLIAVRHYASAIATED